MLPCPWGLLPCARSARLQGGLEVRGFLFGGSGVGEFLLGGEAALRPQQGRGEDDAGGDETGADAEGEVVAAGQRRRGGSAVGEEAVGPGRRKGRDDGQIGRAHV